MPSADDAIPYASTGHARASLPQTSRGIELGPTG